MGTYPACTIFVSTCAFYVRLLRFIFYPATAQPRNGVRGQYLAAILFILLAQTQLEVGALQVFMLFLHLLQLFAQLHGSPNIAVAEVCQWKMHLKHFLQDRCQVA